MTSTVNLRSRTFWPCALRARSYEDLEAYWRKMREEGRTDEMVGIFEEYAETNPADPEAQMLLGNAYLQRVQDSPTGPEMGEWANKADVALIRRSSWMRRTGMRG